MAGCVDAASYLRLGGVFTANMTGNTVLLAIAVAAGNGAAIARSGFALAGFGCGAAAGAALDRLRLGLAVEGAVLAGVAVALAVTGQLHHVGRMALIACGGAAMGLQTSSIRRRNDTGVNVTYITGTTTTAVSRAVDGLLGRRREGGRGGVPLPFAVWVAYAAGAGVGAVVAGGSRWVAFAIPAAVVLVVAGVVHAPSTLRRRNVSAAR